MNSTATIWTIGHSTHTFETFVAMLRSFDIQLLVDVRSFPGSRKFPQFNKDVLQISLPGEGIEYMHLQELGGRKKLHPGSKNTAWRSNAFRAYADYMETAAFHDGLKTLTDKALTKRTAYMCSEAVWWRCHRSLISDQLKVSGWYVMHIMAIGKATEHPYTSAASIINGTLHYEAK
jgi:uncharacterized protein (DUF488 family)